MRVIDLLNKIANGEETFFETKLNDKSVVVKYYNDRNFSSSTDPELLTIADIIKSLNNEVGILEEEKKLPEKLNLDKEELRGKETPRAIDYLIEGKINEVIDYLKNKGE